MKTYIISKFKADQEESEKFLAELRRPEGPQAEPDTYIGKRRKPMS